MISQSLKRSFNKQVEEVIELLDHQVYVIYQNKNIRCSCGHGESRQPDPACKKCLGLGHKIKIKKVMCVCQESSNPKTVRDKANFLIASLYYFKTKDALNNDDIIIDGENVSVVFQGTDYASFDGKKIYQKCTCPPKKSDTSQMMKNFNKIVGR